MSRGNSSTAQGLKVSFSLGGGGTGRKEIQTLLGVLMRVDPSYCALYVNHEEVGFANLQNASPSCRGFAVNCVFCILFLYFYFL